MIGRYVVPLALLVLAALPARAENAPGVTDKEILIGQNMPYSGVVSGFMNMVCQIAGAITTSLTPYIAQQYGWSSAFYVAAVIAAIGAVAWLAVNPGHSLSAQEKVVA